MVISIDEDIETRMTEYISDVFLAGNPAVRLAPNTSLLGSRIIDSLGILEMIEFMEREFGITVEETDMIPDNLDSIEKLTRYIHDKIGGGY